MPESRYDPVTREFVTAAWVALVLIVLCIFGAGFGLGAALL